MANDNAQVKAINILTGKPFRCTHESRDMNPSDNCPNLKEKEDKHRTYEGREERSLLTNHVRKFYKVSMGLPVEENLQLI